MPIKLKQTNIEYDVETPPSGYIILGFDESGDLVYKDDQGNYAKVVPTISTAEYVMLNTDYLTVGYRIGSSSLGHYSIAQGTNISAVGETSMSRGNYTYANAQFSTAEGQYVESTTLFSYAHGKGVSKDIKLFSSGINSFVFSYTNDSSAHGTSADYSFILGGYNQDIGTGALSSGIIGGYSNAISSDVVNTTLISCTNLRGGDSATVSDTVYVPSIYFMEDTRTTGSAGMIRWNGTEMQKHNGTEWLSIGGASFVSGTDIDNRIITANGTGELNGETNLTYDGTTLSVNNALSVSDASIGLTATSSIKLSSYNIKIITEKLQFTEIENIETTKMLYYNDTSGSVTYSDLPASIASSGDVGSIQLADSSNGFTNSANLNYNSENNVLKIDYDTSSTTSYIQIGGFSNSSNASIKLYDILYDNKTLSSDIYIKKKSGDYVGGAVKIYGGDGYNIGGGVYIEGGSGSSASGGIFISSGEDNLINMHSSGTGKVVIYAGGSLDLGSSDSTSENTTPVKCYPTPSSTYSVVNYKYINGSFGNVGASNVLISGNTGSDTNVDMNASYACQFNGWVVLSGTYYLDEGENSGDKILMTFNDLLQPPESDIFFLAGNSSSSGNEVSRLKIVKDTRDILQDNNVGDHDKNLVFSFFVTYPYNSIK